MVVWVKKEAINLLYPNARMNVSAEIASVPGRGPDIQGDMIRVRLLATGEDLMVRFCDLCGVEIEGVTVRFTVDQVTKHS